MSLGGRARPCTCTCKVHASKTTPKHLINKTLKLTYLITSFGVNFDTKFQ